MSYCDKHGGMQQLNDADKTAEHPLLRNAHVIVPEGP